MPRVKSTQRLSVQDRPGRLKLLVRRIRRHARPILGLGVCASVLLLGWLTLRLSGHYLALGTIAWGISLSYVFGNVEGLGGFNGISNLPPLPLFD